MYLSYFICSDCSSAEGGPLKKGGRWTEAKAELQGEIVIQPKVLKSWFMKKNQILIFRKVKSRFLD